MQWQGLEDGWESVQNWWVGEIMWTEHGSEMFDPVLQDKIWVLSHQITQQ